MAKAKVQPQPQLNTILLLLAVISALFVLFVYMLGQRPAKDYTMLAPTPTVKPVSSTRELDTMVKELDSDTTESQINAELLKLSTDSSGI